METASPYHTSHAQVNVIIIVSMEGKEKLAGIWDAVVGISRSGGIQ
jgi:hypothetical protein